MISSTCLIAASLAIAALIFVASDSHAADTSANSGRSPHALIELAQLTEHDLGPENISPTPASPSTGAAIPSSGSSASTPASSSTASAAAASTPQPAAAKSSSPSSSDEQSEDEESGDDQSTSNALTTPAAAATATPALPPLDYANLPPSTPISDSSLDSIIKKTTDPARVASLRVTEEARRQLAAGQPDEAIRALGRAISIDASNPYAYFYLGRSYFVRKQYDQALTFLARAEIGMGTDPAWLGETLGFEGACYEELGRDREAADAYQHAVQVAPGNLMARVGYGRLASELPQPTPTAESPSDIGALDEPPPVEATPAPATAAEPSDEPTDEPSLEPSPSPTATPDNSTDDSTDDSSDDSSDNN